MVNLSLITHNLENRRDLDVAPLVDELIPVTVMLMGSLITPGCDFYDYYMMRYGAMGILHYQPNLLFGTSFADPRITIN